jgi:hypothetical protein
MKLLENLKNVVWTAVVATGSGVGVLVSAILGLDTWVLAFGFIGVISAVLSSRETR